MPVNGPSASYTFGPFRLDVQRRELLSHGIPVELGQRAIEVLLALVSRAGQLVTKDEIMAEVWPGVIVEENNLQVHISALRKVLESAGDPKSFLLTVAGRGYRFVAPVRAEDKAKVAVTSTPATSPEPQRATTLPRPLTSFIGRTQDIAQIIERLSSNRLVTLVGTGGVGKTRLAIETGWRVADKYKDGVHIAQLAPLQDPSLVLTAIAEGLGLDPSSARTAPSVAETVSDRQTLLILDNCEHLIDETATCAEALLRATPNLTILATSRERLAVDGEAVVPIAPLGLPEKSATSTGALSEAVQLFAERARGLSNAWTLTDVTATEIGAICQRLDGIPLAIEMAVPQLRILSLSQIANALDARFKLLSEGSRTALPRHRTLEAVLDWSYALLTEPERHVLQRLSVFARRVGLDEIAAVTTDADSPTTHTFDVLKSLVEKSLVVAERTANAIAYRLLETTREYARTKLSAEAAQILQRRHAEFYRTRLAEASRAWEITSVTSWLERYGADIDELRQALQWTFGPQGDHQLGVDLVANSHVVWGELGLTREHRNWVEKALARVEEATPTQTVAALLSWHPGDVKDIDDPTDYDDALRAAALHHQLGNAFGEAQTLLRAGMVRSIADDGAADTLQKAHQMLTPFGPTKTLARCLSALASSRLLAGDLTQAQLLHEQALSVSQKINAGAVTKDSRGSVTLGSQFYSEW